MKADGWASAQLPGPSLPAAPRPTWAAARLAALRAPWATVCSSGTSGKQQEWAGKALEAGRLGLGPGRAGPQHTQQVLKKSRGQEMGRR